MKMVVFSLFVITTYATPIYTNTGSATTGCLGQGSPAFTIAATGSTIDLACPTPNTGPEVRGYAGGLATGVSIYHPWIPTLAPSFTFQSTLIDTVTVPGSGPGIAEFTITYDWANIGDDGSGTTAGDFWFNGIELWSRSDLTCLFGLDCWNEAAFHHSLTLVFDQPITHGVTFSYQADVSSSGSGQYFPMESNRMTVGFTDPDPVPEPASWLLVALGLAIEGSAIRTLDQRKAQRPGV